MGVGTTETARKWVRREEIDGGRRAGATSLEESEIKRLRREKRRDPAHERDTGATADFSGAELDRPRSAS